MGNTILLHAASVAKKVHLIHLFLVLRLQLLFLSGKPSLKLLHLLLLGHKSSPELLHLFLQLGILLFGLFEFGLHSSAFLSQLVCLSMDRFLLTLN